METLADRAHALMLAKARADEEVVRALLERWVSELEPTVVYQRGEIIGLCAADSLLGTRPFVLRRED